MTDWAEPQIADVCEKYGHPCPDANGRWQKFSCPLHEDKNPSASLSPDGIRMKCFSCDFSGTGVALIREFENDLGWPACNRLALEMMGGAGGAAASAIQTDFLGRKRTKEKWVPPWR